MTAAPRPRLAIVGVSALFPGSPDADAFWRNIRAGADLLTDVPPTHWLIEDWYDPDPNAVDKVYAKRGGFLPPVQFDAGAWGVPPMLMKDTDTSQLLALMAADQVLRDAAGGRFATMDRSRISVILGVTSAQELACTMAGRLQKPVWLKALREHGVPEQDAQDICARISAHFHPWRESTFPGLLGNVVAGRVANRLNLGGTNCVVDAACASTFGALAMAAQELYLGDSEMVITGGVDTINDVFTFECFCKTPALSQSGDCRPFAEAADGTMLGEGLGMFALKRLEDAEREGDPIYAVLSAIGTSSDGRAKSVYAPVPEGQVVALKRAQALAGFEPRSIELVEAHGTGTRAGDLAEFRGLSMAFPSGAADSDRQWCALGSVKSQIGHTKAAAGAAGLFKAVMALRHKVLPPTIKVSRPNGNLDLENSAFYLNTVARPWIRGSAHPRRAAVSSFGFGGSNFHLLLEEYAGPGRMADMLRTSPAELIVLCGANGQEVAARARDLALRSTEPGALAWSAWSSQRRFSASAGARLALVAMEGEPWGERLRKIADRIEQAPERPFDLPDGTAFGLGPAPAGLALLFPGQGSQYPGMGSSLAQHFPSAREVWDRAADLVPGLDRVVFPPPRFEASAKEADELKLRDTRWAQPAIGCASAAMLSLLRGLGIEPSAAAGHSFGEVTALHAAGVFDESTFLGIALRRGQLMAEAGAQGEAGTMSAVLAGKERIVAVLGEGARVVLANINGPQQTVVSGSEEAVAGAEAVLQAAGIRSLRLPVGGAFHSPLIEASAKPLGAFLKSRTFRGAKFPVYSGESAEPYEAEPTAQCLRLGRQLALPVNFSDMVTAMANDGVHTFVEVGPGAVLSSLVDQILEGRPHLSLSLDRPGSDGMVVFLRGLARIAALGVPMRLSFLWEGYRLPQDPSELPKAKLPVAICGSNDKPYPPPGGAAALPPPVQTPRLDPVVEAPPPWQRTEAARDEQDHAPALGPEWLHAWREAQQQTSRAHEAYLRAMDNSQQRLINLTAGNFGKAQGPESPEPYPGRIIPWTMSTPSLGDRPGPAVDEGPSAGPDETGTLTEHGIRSGPDRIPEATGAPVTAPAVVKAPAASISETSQGPDLQAVMLAVVSEKTGYPLEMLSLTMEMEAELGIDSIKRVEILAEVQDRIPGLPTVDAARMSAMRTLGEIGTYLASLMPDARLGVPDIPPPQPSPAPGAFLSATPVQAALPARADPAPLPSKASGLRTLVLAVVADKTGYPVEMLDAGMDMEAELGIDSIKRVEILASIQEKVPDLPTVDAARMGTLRTLGEITDHLDGLLPKADPGWSGTTAPAGVPASAPTTPIGRWVLERVPAPALELAWPGLLTAAEVAVTSDGTGTAEALVAEFRNRGIPARAVDSVPATAEAVVFLGGLRPVESEAEALAVNLEAFRAARAVAQRFAAKGGLFVTVQDTGGGFGLTPFPPRRALLAGLPALVKTLRREWPESFAVAIDLERAGRPAATLARALAEELLAGAMQLEVGLAADGERRTLRSVGAPILSHPGPGPIGPGDVVVVSGGARGVTAACVVEWARRTHARFALLGHSPLEPEPACCAGVLDEAGINRALLAQAKESGAELTLAELANRSARIRTGREIRATLEAVSLAGGEARYHCTDVRDPAGLEAVLRSIRAEWGPISALVHGAGILADKPIANLDEPAFLSVFATKVTGLQALLAATSGDPLRLICLFSSITSRSGNAGQAAYAMANEVLNKMAQAEARQRNGVALVKALEWGPWEGGMVGPALALHFRNLGVPLIPLPTGARMFADEMASGDSDGVEVVLGAEPRSDTLAGKPSRHECEIRLAPGHHGFLEDHRIAGAVVVPMALVAEWFSRAAVAFRPASPFRGLRGLRVLRPLKLEALAAGPTFRVRCSSVAEGTLELELAGMDGTLYYQAKAELAMDVPSLLAWPALDGLAPWDGSWIYGDTLFHGPAFQVIDCVEGIGPAGIQGRVHGVLGAPWPTAAWRTDPLAIDSALQLAMVWARHQLGMAVLPMGLGVLTIADRPVSRGPLGMVVNCRQVNGSKVLADAQCLDSGGRPLFELRGMEMVLRPEQVRQP